MLLWFPASCFAQSASSASSNVFDAPHFSLDAKILYAAASQTAPPAGTNVVVLLDEETYVFDAQGKVVHTEYAVYKVLTQHGIDDWSRVAYSWEPWRAERPAVRARVIGPDGEVHALDPKTISDSPAQDDDTDTYGDRRVVRAPLPAVAIGSVVEEEEISTENPPLPDAGIVALDYFGRTDPVQHSRLVLDAPTSLVLHYKSQLLPNLDTKREEENGRLKITFEQGALGPVESADEDLPSDVPAYPAVIFSTGATWQNLADTYGKIVDGQVGDPNISAISAKLIAGKNSRDEKIEAIFEYLNDQVRYTGIEFGESAIIPHAPALTLKHRYGDCKDKAVLLVALLRAADVPAYVALLNAGQREDVPADLPGIGMFDHAIVYVPGAPDLWIDATANYSRATQLPSADQGRLALVTKSGTAALARTAVMSSRDNVQIEERDIYLPDNGPARIVETSKPHGGFEPRYRRSYANVQDKKVRDDLTTYFKSQYLADKLDRLDRSDPKDFSKPFELVLESNHAKRGSTDLTSSAAAIRFESLFAMLPTSLQQREDPKSDDAANSSADAKKKRTADYQLSEAFVTEWRYKIVPPAGFQPKPLPKNSALTFGPATLTQDFSADRDGVVHAVIRFEVSKRDFSMVEATELRNKVAEIRASEPLLIYFEPSAQALLDQDRAAEAFHLYRDAISAQPKDAIPHLRMSLALLSQGLGDAARSEARLAVQLDPKSALAEKTLADVLQCDLVGRKLRTGSDLAGAQAAYRAAQKLDPADKSIPADLAILMEYNSDGARYGRGADLKGAVAEYRTLTPEDLESVGIKNNVAFTLFYAGEYSDAKKAAEPLNPQPKALIVASEAALNGSQPALDEARKLSGSDKEFKQTALTAGEMLMNVRKYQQAADLMDAGASGDSAAQTAARASMLRKARLHETITYSNDPSGFVMNYFFVSLSSDPTIETVRSFLSRNALVVFNNDDPEEIKDNLNQGKKFRHSLARSGASPDVVLDLLSQLIEPKLEGNDATGYRVLLQIPGGKNETLFVVKEDGKYKILDTSEKPNSIGLEILDRVASADLAGARVLLDWEREDQHIAGGDDPLAGAAFPRIWTKGQEATAEQMKIAGAAILVQTKPTAKRGVDILEPLLASAPNDASKLNIQLALTTGYENLDAFDKLYAAASDMAKQYPQSRLLFLDQSQALRNLRRFDQADALAQDRLKRLPDDVDAYVALAMLAQARDDYPSAIAFEQKIQAAGKADASTLNGIAWISLFTVKVTDADVQTAIRSSQMSPNTWYILHTLGCLYAEVGKTREARDVFLQAMDLDSLDEPNLQFWYGFGRIAEQFGERDLAATDYNKVTAPKSAADIPGSTYLLAQRRLKVLAGAVPETPSSPKKK